MNLLMGVDLGSTSIKAAVFNEKGENIVTASRVNSVKSMDSDNESWLFWDPDEIWCKVKDCISECTSFIKAIGKISALSVTGIGMDGLPVDENGNWIYPFISWQCKRTEQIKDYWSNKIGKERIFNLTGKQVMAIDTIYRILWVKEYKPDVYKRIYKWLLIEDYINYKLCGIMVTDYSMASCTSLMEQGSRQWSREILNIAGIDIKILPPIAQGGEIIGNVLNDVAYETGLGIDTRVILGGHDYSCAAVSIGALEHDKVFDITGTWEMLFAATDIHMLNSSVFNSGFKFESHVARGKYAIFADVVSSLMLEWFKKDFMDEGAPGGNDLWNYMMNIAENAGMAANGVFFLPNIMGKRCPAIDEKSLGAFVGLDLQSDKGAFCRAIIEGLNYQFKEMVTAYEQISSSRVEQVIVCGGITKNKFWLQNKADISDKTIKVPANNEITALGAALLAGIGIGVYSNETQAYEATYREGAEYYPGRDSVKYAEYYEKYYSKLYSIMRELNTQIFNDFKTKATG